MPASINSQKFNWQGEVAINHCVDVKSYTSLHTLVNDMFPPTSLVEQVCVSTYGKFILLYGDSARHQPKNMSLNTVIPPAFIYLPLYLVLSDH